MRKLSVLFVSLCVSIASFAQPQAGNVAVEINFDPFGALSPVFSAEEVRVRYFLSDNMAVRGTLHFSMNSEKDGLYDNDNSLFRTDKERTMMFGIAPGFEFHAVKFERGSVYFGAELGLLFGNATYSGTWENNLGTDWSSRGNVFGYGLNLFTGVDFYLTRNLYIGAEVGFGFMSLRETPNASMTTGSVTIDNSTNTTNTSIGFNAVPVFRLGWTF